MNLKNNFFISLTNLLYLSLYAHSFPSLVFVGVLDTLLRVLKKYIRKQESDSASKSRTRVRKNEAGLRCLISIKDTLDITWRHAFKESPRSI